MSPRDATAIVGPSAGWGRPVEPPALHEAVEFCRHCGRPQVACELAAWPHIGTPHLDTTQGSVRVRLALLVQALVEGEGFVRACRRRGWSLNLAATMAGVARATLTRWSETASTGEVVRGLMAIANHQVSDDALRRVIVLLLPDGSGGLPMLPDTMKLRRMTSTGKPQLEMAVDAERVLALESWVRKWWPQARPWGNMARLTVEAGESTLQKIREAIMAAERWRSLDWTAEDEARWFAPCSRPAPAERFDYGSGQMEPKREEVSDG